jgi:hypothetical protein
MGGFVGNTLGSVGNAFSSVVNGIGGTVKAIEHNPLPLIEAAAITYATGGLGATAAESIMGAEAAGTAASQAIAAAVPAAISNAAVTAINGGSVSQIATAGITAGLTAGMSSGLSASQAIQSMVSDLPPQMAQTVASAAGQSLGNTISSVIQGKDPVTGAVSGAVSGALASSLTNGQIADLNKAAANVIGGAGGAGTAAAINNKNIGQAIGNSLAYGAARAGLIASYNGVQGLIKDLNTTKDNYNTAQTQLQQLTPKLQTQQTTAQDLATKVDNAVTQYQTAKTNYENGGDANYLQAQVDAMTSAANTYNDLKPQYDQALSSLNDLAGQYNTLTSQMDTYSQTATQQTAQLQTASKALQDQYDSYTSNVGSQASTDAAIQARVGAMGSDAQKAFEDAISNGATATDALAAAAKVQSQTASSVNPVAAAQEAAAKDQTQVAQASTTGAAQTSQFSQPTSDLVNAVTNEDGTTTETFADGTKQVVDSVTGNILSQTTPPQGGLATVGTNEQVPTDSSLPADFQSQLDAIKNIVASAGTGTQVAALSPDNQKIATDASQGYLSGALDWNTASDKVNAAVQNDIASGYLKPNGDGTYTAPDGTVYQFNDTTGAWDTTAGVPEGQGTGSDQIVPSDTLANIAAAVPDVSQQYNAPTTSGALPAAQPTTSGALPTVTPEQPTVAPVVTPEQPTVAPVVTPEQPTVAPVVTPDQSAPAPTNVAAATSTVAPSTLESVAQTNQNALNVALQIQNPDLVQAVVDNNAPVIAALSQGDVNTAANLVSGNAPATDGGALPVIPVSQPSDTGGLSAISDVTTPVPSDVTTPAPSDVTTPAPIAADNTQTDTTQTATTTGYNGPVNIPISAGTNTPTNTIAPISTGTNMTTGTSGISGTSGFAWLDYTPHFVKGTPINLVGAPKYTETYISPEEAGEFKKYAEGSSVSFDPRISRGRPQFLRGFSTNVPMAMNHPQIGMMQFEHHAEGHEVGHQPEFYSEGGLSSMQHTYVTGDGDGTSDSIPAMLANGEFVIPADVVSSLGNGSNDAGASILDQFMKVIRQHKRDADPDGLPPDSKGPLAYLNEAMKKAK